IWSVYSNGPTYTASYSQADGGFCIGGNCKTSWAPRLTIASCSSYGYGAASCTATCPSGYTVSGGGCQTSNGFWHLYANIPNGNGWHCAGREDHGSMVYNQYVYGYAMCIN